MFLIGATMGAFFGDGISDLAPGLHVSPAAFALVAMGAAFGAAAKAPFTAVIFCAEVTGQYAMIPPLIVGVVAAELVAGPFFQDRAMTEKLFHRGLRVDFEMWTGVLHQRTARELLGEPSCVLTPSDSLVDARRVMARSGNGIASVVSDDGRYAGLLRAATLDGSTGAVVADALDTEVDPLDPGDFLDHAQIRMIECRSEALPWSTTVGCSDGCGGRTSTRPSSSVATPRRSSPASSDLSSPVAPRARHRRSRSSVGSSATLRRSSPTTSSPLDSTVSAR